MRLGPAVLLAALTVAPSALAESDAVRADALFREGRAASERGDYEKALQKFRASLRLDRSAGTLLNIGDGEEHLGRIASAWQRYQEVQKMVPATDPRAQLAAERARALQPRVPWLTVDLAAAPPGTRVTLDGDPLGAERLNTAMAVDPGRHELAAVAADHEREERTVELGEGSKETIRLSLRPSASTAAPPEDRNGEVAEPVAEPEPARSSTAGWVIGGLGAAALVGSGVTAALMVGRANEAEDACGADKLCPSRAGVDAADSAKTLSTVSTVLFVAGAVGVGVGAYLLLSGGGSEEGPVTALRLDATPMGAGLGVVRSF